MENDFSAIKSIQELKNLLDSGAITPQEYEVLKRKIIFGNAAPGNGAVPLTPPIAPGTGEKKNIVPPPPSREISTPLPIEETRSVPEYPPTTNVRPVTPPVKEREKPIDLINDYSRLNQIENQPAEKKRDWLLTILISLAAILLAGLVAYWLLTDSESERLTSTSGLATEEVMPGTTPETVPGTTPQEANTESPDLNRIEGTPAPENSPANNQASETVVAPAERNTPTAETTPPAPAALPTESAPAPRISEEEAVSKIRNRLQAYYSDFKAAPFAAQNHFAPNVERYYTLIGTTPQAINENINSYHYPEFQDSESTIEEGTLKLVNSGENGFEVTYIEHGKAFRKSKGQKQETTARVRARFDKDFKITFFRQEQLLENKFIEE